VSSKSWWNKKRATKVIIDNRGYSAGTSTLVCRYHDTDVFTIDYIRNKITLRSGGYETKTTKARMNECARRYTEYRYHVFSFRGDWYVEIFPRSLDWAEVVPFKNGMEFDL
jgi:hypothetical protein